MYIYSVYIHIHLYTLLAFLLLMALLYIFEVDLQNQSRKTAMLEFQCCGYLKEIII